MSEYIDKKTGPQKYRVNVLYRGKERWKYCKTIKRARTLQLQSIEAGLNSLIFKKRDGKYKAI